MKITKLLTIHEVKATRIRNTPFQIVLEGSNPFEQEKKSILTLDTDTCTRFNIPTSFDLVGQVLICSFESHEFPLKNNLVSMESIKDNDLKICHLKRCEVVSPVMSVIPPFKHDKISRTLELLSFGGGDGIHFSPLPCPFYRIVLELSDEEYEECKALPPVSVFKVSFCLA